MKPLLYLSALFVVSPALAQEMSQDPIGDARTAISQDADFDAALVILEAFESHALEAQPPVTSSALADMSFLMGVLEFYLNQDEEAAKNRWAWTLQIDPLFKWDEELVGGVGQEVFEGVRQTVDGMASFVPISETQKMAFPVFLDGVRLEPGFDVKPGQHLIQARCGDGVTRGVYSYLSEGAPWICPCPLQSCTKEGGGEKKPAASGDRAKMGVTLNFGNWFSSGEGSSILAGAGLSYRPISGLQIDVGGGIATSPGEKSSSAYRTGGGHLAIALSAVVPRGSMDLSAGVHGVLVLGEKVHPTGPTFYSGLVGGLHLGAAYNLAAGHQIGARLGYSPVVIEGDVMIYMNSVSNVYFKYGF